MTRERATGRRPGARALGVACASALAACTHVPLATMYRMRSFDPATADPAVLRAAVRIPESLEPTPGGVQLVVRYGVHGAGASGREQAYVLEEATSPADTAPLASRARAGTRVHVFRIQPSDVPRMRATQEEVLEARRAAGRSPRGSVTVAAAPCRRGELPDGALLLTTYFRPEPDGEFLPLVEDVDLRDFAPKGKDLRDVLPPCR